MRKVLLALSAAVIALSACQKEPSFEDPNSTPGGGTTGTKLVRLGSRFGTDSITTTYTYTSANLINKYTQEGTLNGAAITAELRTVRNASNIITSTIAKTNLYAQFGFDSVISYHTYDYANSRYKYTITSVTSLGATEVDSVVFSYDATGKLASATDYYDDGSGAGYQPYSRDDYTYTGANLTTTKSYSYDDVSRTYQLDQTVVNEYDGKVNPTLYPAEAVILGMNVYYSANNETKTTTTVVSPASTAVRTIVYTYTNSGKPSVAISSDGTSNSTNTYYYQ